MSEPFYSDLKNISANQAVFFIDNNVPCPPSYLDNHFTSDFHISAEKLENHLVHLANLFSLFNKKDVRFTKGIADEFHDFIRCLKKTRINQPKEVKRKLNNYIDLLYSFKFDLITHIENVAYHPSLNQFSKLIESMPGSFNDKDFVFTSFTRGYSNPVVILSFDRHIVDLSDRLYSSILNSNSPLPANPIMICPLNSKQENVRLDYRHAGYENRPSIESVIQSHSLNTVA